MTKVRAYRLLSVAVLAALPGTALSGALYFPEMSSASESSYAGAGMVARANDAGTAFSNPAGMTRFKESEILAGATGVYIEANFKPRDGTTVEGRDGSVNKRIVPAGSFAYVRPMSDQLWLGFSVHNYFGLAIDWKDNWVGRYSSTSVTLLAPQFQPSVGYKVNDWLSVGAGAAATLGYLKDKMRVAPLFGAEGNDGKLRISDADWAMQYNLAVMLEPTDRTRIGIRYLTETDLDFKDAPDISGVTTPDLPDLTPFRDFTTDTDGIDLGITMPQTIHAAVHHQWNDDLALLGSVGWEEFSEFGKVQVGVGNTGISSTVDEDFRDVWHFGVGAEYKYKPKWELTAGFSLDSSMSSDSTRPISIPLGTMYRYALGFKHNVRDDLIVGGGLSWIWEGNLPIKETGGVKGKYDRVSISVLSVYARWH